MSVELCRLFLTLLFLICFLILLILNLICFKRFRLNFFKGTKITKWIFFLLWISLSIICLNYHTFWEFSIWLITLSPIVRFWLNIFAFWIVFETIVLLVQLCFTPLKIFKIIVILILLFDYAFFNFWQT